MTGEAGIDYGLNVMFLSGSAAKGKVYGRLVILVYCTLNHVRPLA